MNVPAPEFAPLRVSSLSMPPRDRIAIVREEFGRRMLRVEMEPEPGTAFHYEARFQEMPGVRTAVSAVSAMCMRRTALQAADGDDGIGLIVNLGKCARLMHRGREITLTTGDAVMVLHSEAASLSIADPANACAGGSILALVVPRSALASRIGDVEASAARPITRRRQALSLLVSYLRAVQKQAVGAAPELRDAVVAHIYNLTALAIDSDHEPGESCQTSIAEARLAAVLGEIAVSFRSPEISVASVARALNISPRYLHRLLEKTGASFNERVNELRLQKAFAMLSDPGHRCLRISDIAFDVGFSDLSHFNRLFRCRFGEQPNGVRARASRLQT